MEPRQFVDFIPEYVWFMDEPVTEAAAISLYFVSKLLRDHVTVALSGEGADELYGGYDIYKYMCWIAKYRALPDALRSGFVEPILSMLRNEKICKYLKLAQKPIETSYFGVSLNGNDPAVELYTENFKEILITEPSYDPVALLFAKTSGGDPLTRMLYNDFKTWLVDDLLIKADKMTMANGVELRVPFLDYRVIEHAATIPSSMKLRGNTGKWILKEAMKHRLPSSIVSRKKMGFPTPLAAMFRHGLSGYLTDLLLSDRTVNRGYFKQGVVEGLVKEHLDTRKDHHKLLWQLIVLEEWHRQFIDIAPIDRLV